MAAPVPPCGDSNALTAMGFGALPCSDTLNPPPGGVPGIRWMKKQCTECARLPVPHPHLVCGACYEFARAMFDDWYQDIVSMSPLGQRNGARLRTPGPGVSVRSTKVTPAWPPVPAPGQNRFSEFWTRLCVPWSVIASEAYSCITDKSLQRASGAGQILHGNLQSQSNGGQSSICSTAGYL